MPKFGSSDCLCIGCCHLAWSLCGDQDDPGHSNGKYAESEGIKFVSAELLCQFFLSLKLLKKDCHVFSVPQACLKEDPPTRNFPVVVFSKDRKPRGFSLQFSGPWLQFQMLITHTFYLLSNMASKRLPLTSLIKNEGLGINAQNLQGGWWISQAFCGSRIFEVQGPFFNLKDWQFLILGTFSTASKQVILTWSYTSYTV